MAKMKALAALGQAIWLDFIRREFLEAGELKKLVAEGLRGVTSNPSIFEKAIAGSTDYDAEMKKLVAAGKSADEIYEALAILDIQTAADQLRPVYDETDGRDGFVSLEVSPKLAYNTAGTIAEAKRLYGAVNRPNVMIKVPATPEGVPAITELIGCGINVNVTLIFSLESYKSVMAAYLDGLENLAKSGPSVAGGHSVDKVASVASFFVSRVDGAIDKKLEALGNKDLQGKAAVANAKAAYLVFEDVFAGDRWEKLAAAGANVQRPLWASTSTKNPAYSDVLYVDTLIGPHTVNTLPPNTLENFLDHGVVADTIKSDAAQALADLKALAAAGVDMDAVTDKLLADGVAAFAASFDSLLESVRNKRSQFLAENLAVETLMDDAQKKSLADRLAYLKEKDIPNRIWQHDHTVWKDDPTEISNRLGWLHSPAVMRPAIPEIEAFVDDVRAAGYTQALLLGMGGSSLAPEVFRFTFGVKEGYLDLAVLDSTDPGAVLEKAAAVDFNKTLFIVSTKSGGTVETLSFAKYFYNKTAEAVGKEKAGEHFAAVTDPGSKLEALAKTLNFRKTFLNDPDIGGRYSALSCFGSVPAALLGIDLATLYDRADIMAVDSKNPAGVSVSLGAIMGEMALQGRDKITLVSSPALRYFGAWAEQLIAESTGKEGKGILPVDLEALLTPEYYANDRYFAYVKVKGDNAHDAAVAKLAASGQPVVQYEINDLYDLGGEFFRWEIATIIASEALAINPFDQPNVESAKVVAREMVAAYQKEGELPALTPVLTTEGMQVFADFQPASIADALQTFLDKAAFGENDSKGRSYISIHAYVHPSAETDAALHSFRTALQKKLKMATTVGYGPRFLHSTGQLHKGDGGNGLFIQFTADMPQDAAIPDAPGEAASSISFAILKDAQALGDRQALLDNNRQVIRFHLGSDVIAGLQKLEASV